MRQHFHMSRRQIEDQIAVLRDELNDIINLTDEEVREYYNADESTDKRKEVKHLQGEIEYLTARLDSLIEEVATPANYGGLDPAFASWAEVNRMFY